MSSFDPMAAAIDWLDAYRAASLGIVDLYAADSALECCSGSAEVAGRVAIESYWREQFETTPAGTLEDLQFEGADVLVSYRLSTGIARTILQFDDFGKIKRSRCC
jgi:ketosteroid isomerase-like protein